MKPLQLSAAIGLTAIALLGWPTTDALPHPSKLLMANVAISSPFQPLYPANDDNAAGSIQTIAQVCGLDQFAKAHGTDGAGIKIAIIDSGVDVGLPEFADKDKIKHYRDFTTEGILSTKATSLHQQRISIGKNIYQVGDIVNTQPQYKIATLKPDDILSDVSKTDKGEPLTLLLTAQSDKGYDTVHIDTDGDQDFTDETPLGLYNTTRDYLAFKYQQKDYHLLISQIAPDGTSLQVSGDFLGHGTFIAGIIGAQSTDFSGLAPAGELYIYKIFDHKGASDQISLANALHQALNDDVDIINLSLSLPADEKVEPVLQGAINAVRAAGIPMVAAAGNYGSALGTLAFPANQPDVISTGSYIHPLMKQHDMALFLEQDYIPAYSARGNQFTRPTIVAPGGAIAPVPSFFDERYMYDEGTSVAAATTTAALAHLQQYAQLHDAPALDGTGFHTLMSLTAQDLDYPNTDQGYGALNLTHIQRPLDAHLRQQKKQQPILTNMIDGLTVTLHNTDTKPHTIHWQSSQPWLHCPDTTIAPQGEVTQIAQIKEDLPPGHYSAWLKGIDHTAQTPSILLPINYVKPYPAENLTNNTLSIKAAIGQGESRHYYVQIKPDTKKLDAAITIETTPPQNSHEHLIANGRARLQLYDPNGKLIKSTPYIGASYGDILTTTNNLTINKPTPGIWQVSITSSDWLSMYNHFQSHIALSLTATS